MREFPEACLFPQGEEGIEPCEKLSDFSVLRVDVPVKFEAAEFFTCVRAGVAIRFCGKVKRIKPLGERLALAACFSEALRARDAPGLDVFKTFLGHEQLEVAEQNIQVVEIGRASCRERV